MAKKGYRPKKLVFSIICAKLDNLWSHRADRVWSRYWFARRSTAPAGDADASRTPRDEVHGPARDVAAATETSSASPASASLGASSYSAPVR